MKLKTLLFFGLCAVMAGAGMGVSMAQSVPDHRCRDCQTFFMACLYQCDLNGGEGCYAACGRQRRLCEATFCP